MNALVLIGLVLIAAGLVLLAMRFAPRVRRQFAAPATQPRTVADLVRLREEAGNPPVVQPSTQAQPASVAPATGVAGRADAAVPAADTVQPAPQARPSAPARRVASLAKAPQARPNPATSQPAPTAAAPRAPRPEPAPAGPPPARLDGGDAPWQRGARMAAGLGGGQPWQEPPPPPAALRIVPSAEPAVGSTAPVEVVEPIEPAAPAPEDATAAVVPSVRLVPAEPGAAADAPEEADESPAAAEPDASAGHTPAQLVPAVPAPETAVGSASPGHPAAVAPEDGHTEQPAARERAESAPLERDEPAPVLPAEAAQAEHATDLPAIPGGWDDMDAEDVPAEAVPDRFAEARIAEPDAPGERVAGRRSRRTPDERAAEEAAADLALLRTFGFVDPGQRPDSAPVVAMAHREEDPPTARGKAQPVRYRVIRRDGSVVGGANVTLLDDRGGDVAAGTADAAGSGELMAPTSGGYVLVSTAAGHQPGAVAITVGNAATVADVLLARSASVFGTVRGEDGPIAGARVTLVQDGEAIDAVDTDACGAYRIGDVGGGEYGLSVAAAGCEPAATLLDVAEEADVHYDVELTPASPVADGDLVDDAVSGRR
jgi:Carboxypeptidase regulatory-like domain